MFHGKTDEHFMVVVVCLFTTGGIEEGEQKITRNLETKGKGFLGNGFQLVSFCTYLCPLKKLKSLDNSIPFDRWEQKILRLGLSTNQSKSSAHC